MLRLMEIMSSGVYIKNGDRIRLTQKQRDALSSTMIKVSEQILQKETKDKTQGSVAVENMLSVENERG